MRLIVGLGNPGNRYKNTRHNVGFGAVSILADRHGLSINQNRFLSLVARGRVAGADVFMALPQTYMNLSGRAVRRIVDFYKLETEDILVLHDDLDVETGRIKVSAQGGPGGHKGIASIIENLGRQDFTRVRIGIGRPPAYMDPADYVLQRFGSEETELMDMVLVGAAEAAEVFITEGVAAAQSQFNRKDLKFNQE